MRYWFPLLLIVTSCSLVIDPGKEPKQPQDGEDPEDPITEKTEPTTEKTPSTETLTAKPRHSTGLVPDVDGDGMADICARAPAGILCWLSNGSGSPISGPALSDDDGWSKPEYYSTIQTADVNGDGMADICARGPKGITCWLSNGAGFPTAVAGPALSDGDGWNKPEYYKTIQMADVNGDGMVDICARGPKGITCWLSNGEGFATTVAGPTLSDSGGWNQPDHYSTIQTADVNGDGMADICARSSNGMICWLSDGSGFPNSVTGPALSGNNWNKPEQYSTIRMADVNGDGKADICARASSGMTCWLSNGAGFPDSITGPELSDGNGWNLSEYYSTIRIADVNGDRMADVCARAAIGMLCWLSDGSGFPTEITGPTLSDDRGWSEEKYYSTIQMADVNGDDKVDICAHAIDGMLCWLSTGSGFPTEILRPLDDAGVWTTIRYDTH